MEHWKPLVGYAECYAVSDLGRLARTATYGRIPKKKWKLCALRLKRDGYVSFHLSKDGKVVDYPAHRAVWEAFIGPIPEGLEINHKNSKRSDNRLKNLELLTRSENAAYAFRHNSRPPANNPNPGSRNGSAKLSETDIPKIVALYDGGLPQWQIGDRFGVSQRTISLILRGENWRHVKRRQYNP